jgi:hypothetical protein
MQTNTITSQTTSRGHERWNFKIIIRAFPLSILSVLRIYYKHLGPWPDGVVSYRGGREGRRIQLRWRLSCARVTGCIGASRGWPPPARAHTHTRTHWTEQMNPIYILHPITSLSLIHYRVVKKLSTPLKINSCRMKKKKKKRKPIKTAQFLPRFKIMCEKRSQLTQLRMPLDKQNVLVI